MKTDYEVSLEKNATEKMAQDFDKAVCDELISKARITQNIGADNFIENLKKAIEYMNTPDYYLLSNPDKKEELDKLEKTIEDLKIHILYSPVVPEDKLVLVKYGAITRLTYMKPVYQPYSVAVSNEYKVNPDEVRVLRVNNGKAIKALKNSKNS